MHKIKLSALLALTLLAMNAHASTANLWYNLHTGKSRSFASAAAACRYIGTVPGRELGKNRGKCWKDGENGFPGFEMSEYWAEPKTCNLNHIEGKGRYGSHLLSFEGVDKAPTMQRRCQDNCEVEYQRAKPKEGQGADFGMEICNEVGGKSYCVSDYTALQTGTVCNPKPGESNETTKYDEVNDDAAGDDSGKDSGGDNGSGKPDGGGKDSPNNPGKTPDKGQDGDKNKNNGGAGGGDAGGNQSGGQGGAGKDSEGDSGAADDPNKIDDKKPKPGGGGSHKGGGSGDTGSADGGSVVEEIPLDVWLRCPSGRGSYKRGTVPTGECAAKPKQPEKPKPDTPKTPDDPKNPAQPPQPPNPPPKPDDTKKPGGGHHGGGGGGGSKGQDGKDGADGKPGADGKDGSSGGSGNKGNHGGGHDGPGGNTGGSTGGSKGGAGGKDNDSGSPDGKGNGDTNGDGKGKGSGISGGDCKANKAPVCKGDPVQCYIAKEQWRTACLAERGGGEVKGGSCKDNKPPECKGDATQCYIVKQQFYQGCEAARAQADRDSEQDYVNDNAKAIGEVAGSGMDDVAKGLEGNGKSIDLGSVLDLNGYGWSRTCPVIAPIDMGKWGKLEMDTSAMCVIAKIVGNIMVAMSLMFSVRYVLAGV